MNKNNGPAGWHTWPAGGSAETLLLLADETAEPGTAWLSLPGRPNLHRDAESRPVVGLTLVLSRHPEPDEPAEDLVELGHFAFELSLAASAKLVAAAAEDLHAQVRPLFANSVTATLAPADGTEALVTAHGAGADAVVALSATLSRAQALAVLAAFRGNPSDLLVGAHIECVTPTRQREVHLYGRWYDVHTRLAAVAGPDGRICGVAVRAVLAELLADGTVLVRVDGEDLPDGLPPDKSEAVMAAFLKAVGFLLHRETTNLPAGDPANQYTLRKPPNPSFPLDVRMTTQLPGSARTDLTVPLEGLLGGVLDGLELDRYVRTVVPDHGSDPARQSMAALATDPAPFSVRRPPPPPDGEPDFPPLPVYTGVAPYWQDGMRPEMLWYAPEFIVQPVTSDGPVGTSGFVFSFARTESQSGPKFTGRVRLRLRSGMSVATKQALKQIGATAEPVPIEKLAVYLEIPFRDNQTGQTRAQLCTGVLSVEQDCVIVADFDLLDDWVRLAYGALSTPGFQTRPPRLRVEYSFRACWLSDGDMAAAFASILPGPTVTEGSIPWTVFTPVSYPCATFPALYRQRFPDGERAVGCQDVLRLGEVAYQQFVEVTALREAFAGRCRIYRSLLQPGLFLIVPVRYRITRFGQTEAPERAFRPDVLIYAVLHEEPADNRYLMTATLQPDLSPDLRHDLETRLIAYTPNGFAPRLVMPTDPAVGATDRYVWAPGVTTDRPEVSRAWDSLHVKLSTGLVNAMLVTRMIEGNGYSGTVTFTLPDGLTVDALLVLDSYVAGPWETGPVTLELSGTTAKLTNRIERTVTVPELLVDKSGVAATVPVAASLAAGKTTTVPLPAGVTGVWPRCTPAGGPLTIEELDVFIEDVTADLIFVDLITHATHGLALLHVDVRLLGSDTIRGSADLTGPNTRIQLTLPVTSYLEANSVQFRFTRRMTDGSTVTGGWLAWHLPSKGNVISVTWEMVSTGVIRGRE